jgi:death-on-curing protein
MYLNEKIIKKFGGALGEVNKGNLDFSIGFAINAANKVSKDEKLLTFVSHLLRNIAVNHPFKDGNKRTAYLLTRFLLLTNGFYLKTPYDENTIKFIIDVANKKKTIGDIKKWIKKHIYPIDNPDVKKDARKFRKLLLELFSQM